MVTVLNFDDAVNKEGDDRQITLSISQHYVLMSLADKLISLPGSFYEDYASQDFEDVTDFNDALMNAILDDTVPPVPNTSPYQHDYFHLTGQNNIGNGIVPNIQTGQIFNHVGLQSAPAQHDEWYSPPFWLKAGIYVADFYFLKSVTSGIVDLEWRLESDDSVLTEVLQDLYSAAIVNNFKVTLGHTFTEDTLTYFRGKTSTKNASSTNYNCPLTCCLVRS